MRAYIAALLHAIADRINPREPDLEDMAAGWMAAMRTPRGRA